MICPECKYEFRADLTHCPDCGLELVEHAPSSPVAQTPDDSWVSVCSICSGGKSEIAKGVLDSNNIPSVVMARALALGGESDQASNGRPEAPGLLMVPREFAEEAEMIIEAVLGDDIHLSNR